jgi:hypothetical protein
MTRLKLGYMGYNDITHKKAFLKPFLSEVHAGVILYNTAAEEQTLLA